MKLTKEEKSRIISIITRFESLSDRMDSYEKELEDLDKKRINLYQKIKTLAEEIEAVREEEQDFTALLIAEHGDFTLDIKTLDIITKNG